MGGPLLQSQVARASNMRALTTVTWFEFRKLVNFIQI
jgi:hypothetical protein